jgi:hypothetical protein
MKVTFTLNAVAFKALMDSIPSHSVGISDIHIEYDGSQSNGHHQPSTNHHRGRKPSNGKQSIGAIIIAAFENKSEFTHAQACSVVESAGYGAASAGSGITRLMQKGGAARVGIGTYKIIGARS